MKKFSLLSAVLLLSLGFVNAGDDEINKIINANLEAKGGVEALQNIKSMNVSGKMVMMGGQMELPMNITFARPGKMLMSMSMQGMEIKIGVTEEDAWMVMPMMGTTDPQDVPAAQMEQINQQRDFEGPLVNWKEKGTQIELVGKEEVEGTECYKLKVTPKDGTTYHLYMDTESFVEIKMVGESMDTMGNTFEAHTYFSEFNEVGGFMMAHNITTKTGDGMTMMEMVMDKFEVNAEIEDASFERPKPAAAPEKKDGQ